MVMSRDRVFDALQDAGVNEDVATWMADQLERDRSAQLTREDLDAALALFRLEVKSDIDAAKAVLTAEMDGAIKVLDQRIAALDRDAGLLRDDFKELHGEVKDLRGEVKDLREELGVLRSDMHDLEKRLDGKMAEMDKSLRAEMGEMEKRLDGKMGEMEKGLRAEMGEMERRLRGEIQKAITDFHLEINGVRTEQRWLFGILAAMMAALIGVVASGGG